MSLATVLTLALVVVMVQERACPSRHNKRESNLIIKSLESIEIGEVQVEATYRSGGVSSMLDLDAYIPTESPPSRREHRGGR